MTRESKEMQKADGYSVGHYPTQLYADALVVAIYYFFILKNLLP